MSKGLSAKYYQKSKENIQKNSCNMVAKDKKIKISQKMEKKG